VNKIVTYKREGEVGEDVLWVGFSPPRALPNKLGTRPQEEQVTWDRTHGSFYRAKAVLLVCWFAYEAKAHCSRHQSENHEEARYETGEAHALAPEVPKIVLRVKLDVKSPDQPEKPIPSAKPSGKTERYQDKIPCAVSALRSVPERENDSLYEFAHLVR
jgi:hypothetical protein